MSLRKISLGTALSAAFAGTLMTAPAKAADLDPVLEYPASDISAMPLANVVFGTGWYVRGDFGGVQLFKANPFTQQQTVLNTSTVGSYAAGAALKRSSNLGYTADIGAGYSFNRWFRFDVTGTVHQPLHASAFRAPIRCQTGFTAPALDGNGNPVSFPTYSNCSGNSQARLQSYVGLVNGYLDLGTWYNVTPYVGAGVGLAFGHAQYATSFFLPSGASYNGTATNPANFQTSRLYFDRIGSDQYYNFAFALMAGVAFDVFDHTKLDIGYRYLNEGRVFGTTLDTHEVHAGLRYMIDN